MEPVNILNKRILYISAIWIHYDQFMIKKLTESGAIVEPFRIDINDLYFRIVKKLKLPQAEIYEHNHYKQLTLKKDFDYVLVRFGFQLDLELIRKLRMLNPNAKFINFHWDSLRDEYNYLAVIDCFDRVYSFDYKDCQNHSKIEYLPLFYIDEYALNNNSYKTKKDIDLLFVGEWKNKERYDQVKSIERICKENYLHFYFYLWSPFKWQFDSIRHRGIIQKEARAKRLSHKQILELFTISNAVIDLPSSFQTGLTMRVFETLGAGLKIITTNRNIKNEPFYNPEYINVIDIKNLNLDIDFLNNVPKSSMTDMIKDYSIGNYLNKLLQ